MQHNRLIKAADQAAVLIVSLALAFMGLATLHVIMVIMGVKL